MSIQIGRFGLDIAANDPMSWTQRGDTATIDGVVFSSTTNALLLRQQLENYVGNPFERYVPLYWTADPARKGFYKIETVDTTTDADTLAAGKLQLRLSGTRAPAGFSYPMIEKILSGAGRTGKPGSMAGIFSEATWDSVPALWDGYDAGYNYVVAPYTRTMLGGGAMRMWTIRANTTPNFYNGDVTVGADPLYWYTGAATLRTGSPLQAVVGAQVVSDPTHWEISNGLVTIGSTTGAGNHFTVTWTNAAGSGSGTAWGYHLGTGHGPIVPIGVTPRSLRVLRNSPEEVIIRLTYNVSASTSSSVELDLSLRRGSRFVAAAVSSFNPQQWAIGFASTAGCSYNDPWGGGWTVGCYETVNNLDGDRRLLSSGTASAAFDLTEGTCYRNTAGTLIEIMIGNAVGGGGAVVPDTADRIQDQYFAAMSELCTVTVQ